MEGHQTEVTGKLILIDKFSESTLAHIEPKLLLIRYLVLVASLGLSLELYCFALITPRKMSVDK